MHTSYSMFGPFVFFPGNMLIVSSLVGAGGGLEGK